MITLALGFTAGFLLGWLGAERMGVRPLERFLASAREDADWWQGIAEEAIAQREELAVEVAALRRAAAGRTTAKKWRHR